MDRTLMKTLEWGKPDLNGRVYTKDSFNTMEYELNKLVVYPAGGENKLEKAIGIIKEMEFRDDGLYARFEWTPTMSMMNLVEFGKETLCLRPFGVGVVDKDNVISDYQLRGFSFMSRF